MSAQRTIEWHEDRCGRLTASRFADAIATTQKGAPTAARTAYLTEKVVERLTGQPAPHFESIAMRWGIEHEDAARELYVDRCISHVRECGFLVKDGVSYAGASPDGLVDHVVEASSLDDSFCLQAIDLNRSGAIEIKCPYNPANHLATWLDGMPKEHVAQVQGVLWVTGRAWCDFISYDPRFPEGLDLYVERIERDPEYIDQLQADLARAWLDVLEMEGRIVDRVMQQWRLFGMSGEPVTRLTTDLALSVAREVERL